MQAAEGRHAALQVETQAEGTALRAADRRKDIFVATMAHELRQPLSAILPALGILDAGIGEQSSARARAVIRRQVEQLQRTVEAHSEDRDRGSEFIVTLPTIDLTRDQNNQPRPSRMALGWHSG